MAVEGQPPLKTLLLHVQSIQRPLRMQIVKFEKSGVSRLTYRMEGCSSTTSERCAVDSGAFPSLLCLLLNGELMVTLS